MGVSRSSQPSLCLFFLLLTQNTITRFLPKKRWETKSNVNYLSLFFFSRTKFTLEAREYRCKIKSSAKNTRNKEKRSSRLHRKLFGHLQNGFGIGSNQGAFGSYAGSPVLWRRKPKKPSNDQGCAKDSQHREWLTVDKKIINKADGNAANEYDPHK